MPTTGIPTVLLVCGSLQRPSANQAVLDVVADHLEGRATVVEAPLGAVPPLDPGAAEPHPAVEAWRAAMAGADAVIIATPEYAGGLSGLLKNALDWLVGTGEAYRRPVALISAGTTGGPQARIDLARTLTWQGAFVVGQLGIESPRTKSNADGAFDHPDTLAAIRTLADDLVALAAGDPETWATRARQVVAALGIDPARVTAA